MKELYSEKYRNLKKGICIGYQKVERCSLLLDRKDQYYKMAKSTVSLYRFNEIPTKIPAKFFTKLDKANLKFIWNQKRFRKVKAILGIRTKAGGNAIPVFKLHLQQ